MIDSTQPRPPRIPRGRKKTFTVANERQDLESSVVSASLERSLSPKFIFAKKVTPLSYPKNLRPVSIKIQKKILEPFSASLKQNQGKNKSFVGQLNSLNSFQKIPQAFKTSKTLTLEKPDQMYHIREPRSAQKQLERKNVLIGATGHLNVQMNLLDIHQTSLQNLTKTTVQSFSEFPCALSKSQWADGRTPGNDSPGRSILKKGSDVRIWQSPQNSKSDVSLLPVKRVRISDHVQRVD